MIRWCKLGIFLTLLSLFGAPAVHAEEPVRVFVNEYQVIFDQLPIIDEGTTLDQFRPSFEALGFAIQWDDETSSITGTAPNLKVQLQVDSKTASINGEARELPAAPRIVNGSTFVPIRFLGEVSGGDVTWDPKTKHVDIVNDKG